MIPGHPLRSLFFALLSLFALTTPSQGADHSALFIGNSYTGANAPDSLESSYRQLVEEGQAQWADLVIEKVAPGGYTLARHYADLQGSASIADYLNKEAQSYAWDFVLLQDQSQIPAFPPTQAEWQDSRDGAVGLAARIEAIGGKTRLLATWGRRDGDSGNAWRFPDFLTMQALLNQGYEAYREAIAAAGSSAEVIYIGDAFKHVYETIAATGVDPTDGDTLFTRLYSGDGSHPAVHGTYLAACVIYGSLTESSPVGLIWSHDGISDEDRLALQEAAEAVVFPITGDDDDDSSTSDDDHKAGGDDDDSAAGGDDDDSAKEDNDLATGADTSSANDSSRSSGCSCTIPGTGAAGWLWMTLPTLLLLRRKCATRPEASERPRNEMI